MRPDTPGDDREGVAAFDFDDLVVNYVVFQPGTAEVKLDGRVYYQRPFDRANSPGGSGRSRGREPRPPRRVPAEPTPERAGRAAAERVLASFKEVLPSL
ncbi:MAG TPA: hypothetical protein VF507_05265 [Pyrinomonadaceae bacterium]